MKVQRLFFNIRCDCCGSLLDEECWMEKEAPFGDIENDCNWKQLGGKDYCPDCYTIDDDDNYVTKNGHKYNGETEEEIFDKPQFRLNYLRDLETGYWTLTQFRTELVKAEVLYQCMVGTSLKSILGNEIEIAYELFRRMLIERQDGFERECYNSFNRARIFEKMKSNFYENLFKPHAKL